MNEPSIEKMLLRASLLEAAALFPTINFFLCLLFNCGRTDCTPGVFHAEKETTYGPYAILSVIFGYTPSTKTEVYPLESAAKVAASNWPQIKLKKLWLI